MASAKPDQGTIDQYIAGQSEEAQKIMQELRATIHKAAPGVQETVKYGMPTLMLDGDHLVYFAAAKKHVGVYPVPSTGTAAFNKKIAPYRAAKLTMQLPLDKPVPYPLISQLVRLRVKENKEWAKEKAAKQTKAKSASRTKSASKTKGGTKTGKK